MVNSSNNSSPGRIVDITDTSAPVQYFLAVFTEELFSTTVVRESNACSKLSGPKGFAFMYKWTNTDLLLFKESKITVPFMCLPCGHTAGCLEIRFSVKLFETLYYTQYRL